MPIDQIKDWKNIWAPVALICEKVSRAQIQQTYSLVFPLYKDLVADDLLNAYARMRSFYKDHGRPDEAHAARIILKDFSAGKLLYAHPPPLQSFEARAAFYKSFHIGGHVLINESLYLSAQEVEDSKARQLAESVEGLGAREAREDEAATVGARQVPVTTQRKNKAAAKAAAKRAKQAQAIRDSKDESGEEEEDGEDEESEEEDDEDGEEEEADSAASGAVVGADVDLLQARRVRATVNQAALSAQMRDDLSVMVQPHSQASRDAAKLLAQGFNPDGTPLSKKQLQRMGQRNKKKTGKAFKLRKTNVAMEDVGFRTGGKSSDSAARLGVFHG